MARRILRKPNTNEPFKGKTPRQMEHAFCLDEHICDRCRSRWAPANHIYCDVCAAKIATASAGRHRRVHKKRDTKRPYMAQVTIAPDLARGKHAWVLGVYTDIGKAIEIRGLHSVDQLKVNPQTGKAILTSFRHPDKPVSTALRKGVASSRRGSLAAAS